MKIILNLFLLKWHLHCLSECFFNLQSYYYFNFNKDRMKISEDEIYDMSVKETEIKASASSI